MRRCRRRRGLLTLPLVASATLLPAVVRASAAGLPPIDDPAERWLGSMWIPSDGRLRSKAEIRAALHGKRILCLGDSLGRRLGATLAAVLASADEEDLAMQVLDDHDLLSLGMHGLHIYDGVPEGDRVAFQWAPMLHDLRAAAEQMIRELSENSGTTTTAAGTTTASILPADGLPYTDIVVAIGVHDAMMPFRPEHVQADVKKSMALFGQSVAQWGTRVIWRTSPYRWETETGPAWIYQKEEGDDTARCGPGRDKHDDPVRCHQLQEPQYSREVNARLESINDWIRHSFLVYQDTVDVTTPAAGAGAMRLVEFAWEVAPRSIGKARLAGDSAEHFSSLARMVCIQMLVRTWIELANNPDEPEVRALDSDQAHALEAQDVENLEGEGPSPTPPSTAEAKRVLDVLLRGAS